LRLRGPRSALYLHIRAALRRAPPATPAARRGAQDEAAMLRRALGEAMRRLTAASSDAGALVDRRIVVKLLVTFFERGRSPEVLALMARMLGMSGAARRGPRGAPARWCREAANRKRALAPAGLNADGERARRPCWPGTLSPATPPRPACTNASAGRMRAPEATARTAGSPARRPRSHSA
jgi:hypothetical protein